MNIVKKTKRMTKKLIKRLKNSWVGIGEWYHKKFSSLVDRLYKVICEGVNFYIFIAFLILCAVITKNIIAFMVLLILVIAMGLCVLRLYKKF